MPRGTKLFDNFKIGEIIGAAFPAFQVFGKTINPWFKLTVERMVAIAKRAESILLIFILSSESKI